MMKFKRAVLLIVSMVVAIGARTTGALAQVAGELRGRITDAGTTRAVANSRIEIAGRTELVRTGVDGAFVVRGLEPGTYSISVRAFGYAAFTQEIEIRNGHTTMLDATLVARVAVLTDVQVRAARNAVPLNTMVFDRTTIEQSGRRDLGELLQSATGVVITQAGGPGQPSRVSIRGSSSNQVLVLMDGVPLNSAISGSADLSLVSLESVERVTVHTGAQSSQYGSGAMAGVIEIETRKPRHEASTMLRAGALGERNASVTLGNTLGVRHRNLGAFASADYRTVEGNFAYDLPALRGGGRASRINSDATSKQLVGGVSADGGLVSASLRGTWQETERGLAGTIIQPSSTGRQSGTRTSVGANAQGVMRQVAWTFATDVTHEAGTFIDRSPPFGRAFDDTLSATGVTTTAGATVRKGAAIASGGAEFRTLDIRSTMLARAAPHWQQLLGAWGTTQLTRELSPTVRVDAELSGRIDHNSHSDAVFSPRGVLRVSRGALTTSVSLGSGYSPPTLSDQFFHEGVQVRANPSLRAERTQQDLEGRLTLRESNLSALTVFGEAAVYRSDIDGMILWFPDFQFIWSPNNFDVRRSGWDLNGKLGVPVTRLAVSGTFNRNDVSYTGDILHGQVAYRPRTSANVNVSWAPKLLRLDVTNRYVGTRRTIPGSALNSLNPYWMSDVRVSTSLAFLGWTFQPAAGVENVFNRAAAMLVDYPFPPRTWNISLRVRRSTSQSP